MRWIIVAAAAALVVPTVAAAQPKPAAGCSQGDLTRIRLSKIKPGGSLAGFRDAVAAPQAEAATKSFLAQRLMRK